MADYVSPGAAFGGAFDNFLMEKARQQHQTMLDDLAVKREQRMAQADMDSRTEHQDELRRRVQKDKEDAQDKKAKDFEKRVGNMVKGDRPDPEMLEQAKSLGMAGIFRQQAPAMSTESMQPPAALMEAPPPNAPVEGAAAPTPEGAMTAGPTVYPGSPKERQDEAQRGRAKAFIDSIPDDDPRKQELAMLFEAENAGLKIPAGALSKAPTKKTRIMFDPAKGVYKTPDGKVITDVPDDAAIDRLKDPTDHSGADATREASRLNHVDSIREHAFTELNTRSKPVEDMASNLNKLTMSLNENSNIADSTLAEQIIKVTAGGANSGVRITLPEIEQVLKKSRTKWEDLQVALNKWALASPDEKNSGLFYTPEQKQAMRDLVKTYRTKVNASMAKLAAARSEIVEAGDVPTINRTRSRIQQELFSEVPDESAPKPKRTAEEILKGI